MPKQKIDQAHYLEMLDRLHVQMSMMEAHLIKHPVTEESEELKRLIIKSLVTLVQASEVIAKLANKKKKAKNNHV
jgi:hypothetical protein